MLTRTHTTTSLRDTGGLLVFDFICAVCLSSAIFFSIVVLNWHCSCVELSLQTSKSEDCLYLLSALFEFVLA